MKKLFRVNLATTSVDAALLFARVAIAALMLTHGLPKMEALFSDGPVAFPPVLGLTPALSLSLAVFAEVICSVFVLIGLGTRLAVVPLAITMLVAVLAIHANDPFAMKEMALHYLFAYVVLFLTGSGRYSLDFLFQGSPRAASYSPIIAEDPTLSIYQ